MLRLLAVRPWRVPSQIDFTADPFLDLGLSSAPSGLEEHPALLEPSGVTRQISACSGLARALEPQKVRLSVSLHPAHLSAPQDSSREFRSSTGHRLAAA